MTCLETAHIDFHITRKATCALKSEKKTSQWSKVQALCYSHSKLLVSLVFFCSKPYQLIFLIINLNRPMSMIYHGYPANISNSTFNADMVPSCQLVQIGQDLIPRLLLKVGQREGWEVLGGLPLLPQGRGPVVQ